MSSSYNFPGYPPFVEAAAIELGRPESAIPARRVPALTALANLCSQATHADPSQVEGILAKANEFRDQLQTALRAADLMLADVRVGCTRPVVAESSPAPLAVLPRESRAGSAKTTRGPR